jgi:adenylosuccinate lyase
MASIFTDEAKLASWMKVEAALSHAQAHIGNIPETAAIEIQRKGTLEFVKLDRVKEIEADIHHDLMAMVRAISEVCDGDAGNYVHLGATSYDIEDTALGIILSKALLVLEESLKGLLRSLVNQSKGKRDLVCVGRTHGQHALPTTYGMRFGVWAAEFDRHIDRLNHIRDIVLVGKMSGAVGTMASFRGRGRVIQKIVMKRLGLKPVRIANQVVQRDRYAELLTFLGLVSASCDKIAREIRVLQRNEIAEVFEPFRSKQVGSSTMPHKRNPHKSERICGLARVIKSNVFVALENVTLEDERDLTNSSSERVIFPEGFILLDFILHQLNNIIENLEFNYENIERNLNLNSGIMTERIMLELVDRGIGRQDAHEILRSAIIKSRDSGQRLKEILLENPVILEGKISESELDTWLDPTGYIGESKEIVDDLVSFLESKHGKSGVV